MSTTRATALQLALAPVPLARAARRHGLRPNAHRRAPTHTTHGNCYCRYSNATNWVATCNCSVGRQDADCLRAGAAPFAAAHTIASMLVAVAVAAWHNA